MKTNTVRIIAETFRARPLARIDQQAAATIISGKIRDGSLSGQISLDRKYSNLNSTREQSSQSAPQYGMVIQMLERC